MDQFVCASVIDFTEGDSEGMALHFGSRESCERVADAFPAVAYSGNRKVVGARMCIMTKAEWDGLTDPLPPPPAPEAGDVSPDVGASGREGT